MCYTWHHRGLLFPALWILLACCHQCSKLVLSWRIIKQSVMCSKQQELNILSQDSKCVLLSLSNASTLLLNYLQLLKQQYYPSWCTFSTFLFNCLVAVPTWSLRTSLSESLWSQMAPNNIWSLCTIAATFPSWNVKHGSLLLHLILITNTVSSTVPHILLCGYDFWISWSSYMASNRNWPWLI